MLPVDEELHPLPPRHTTNPPSLRPHLQEPRVLGDFAKWQSESTEWEQGGGVV